MEGELKKAAEEEGASTSGGKRGDQLVHILRNIDQQINYRITWGFAQMTNLAIKGGSSDAQYMVGPFQIVIADLQSSTNDVNLTFS